MAQDRDDWRSAVQTTLTVHAMGGKCEVADVYRMIRGEEEEAVEASPEQVRKMIRGDRR